MTANLPSLSSMIFGSRIAPNLDRVPEELRLDTEHRVTPFDYGYIAFVYDSERLTSPPKSLADLTDPRFAGKIVIESPKTSSPGLSMLHWTVAVYGEEKVIWTTGNVCAQTC